MVSIRIWVDVYRIISVCRRILKVVSEMKEQLEAGKGPKNSGEFITMLIGSLFERMESVFTDLNESLDETEEKVMEEPNTSLRQQIAATKKKAILLRCYIAPQRDVITALRTSDQPWLDLTHRRHLQESLDRVIRYLEDIDSIRERAQITKDELTNALADKMNKNLYMLSVVAPLFLALGFLTGLLAVNVGGVPGVDAGNAFFIFCLALIGVSAAQMALFKYLKWF
ncbi:MAG: zinc transporter [Pseudohongiellaceae bacterium]|jgi:zinc transporter